MKLPKLNFQLAILVILSTLATGCKKTKETEPTTPVATPTAVTIIQSDVTYNSIDIIYTLQSPGPEAITEIGICWDTLPNPNISKNKLSSTSLSASTRFNMTSLNKNLYYISAFVKSASGIRYFSEIQCALPVSWITGSQSLNGKITCIADWGWLYKYVGTDNNGLFEFSFYNLDWTQQMQNPKNIQALISNYDEANSYVFAATSEGVYRKDLNGWEQINTGLKSLNATKLVKNHRSDVYTLADGLPYLWMGIDWREIPLPPSITVSNMWKGSYGVLVFDKPAGKIYRMNDGRDTFSLDHKFPVLCNAPAQDILTIEILNEKLYLGSTDGAFISNDDGQTWTEVMDPLVKGHRVSAFLTDRYGVCAVVDNEVFRVKDSQAWSVLCPGLPKDKGPIIGINGFGGLFVFFYNGTSSELYRL